MTLLTSFFNFASWFVEAEISVRTWCFPDGSDGEESACNAGDPVSIPGLGDPLEKEVTTHSSILAWEIPWKRNLVGYSSRGRIQFSTTKWLTNTPANRDNFNFLWSWGTYMQVRKQQLELDMDQQTGSK